MSDGRHAHNVIHTIFFLNQSPHELFYFMLYFGITFQSEKEGSCFHG